MSFSTVPKSRARPRQPAAGKRTHERTPVVSTCQIWPHLVMRHPGRRLAVEAAEAAEAAKPAAVNGALRAVWVNMGHRIEAEIRRHLQQARPPEPCTIYIYIYIYTYIHI